MYQVMIVDDEPTSVNLLKTVIEKKCDGFQVTEIAYDGTEAMEKLKGVQPDILITDIQMQVMSGLELVKRIGEISGNALCTCKWIRNLNMRNRQFSTEFRIISLNQLFRQI